MKHATSDAPAQVLHPKRFATPNCPKCDRNRYEQAYTREIAIIHHDDTDHISANHKLMYAL